MKAYVINDGGFEYGMDRVTPAWWRFSNRRLRANVYREWTLPDYMIEWAKLRPNWFGTYNELCAVARSLRSTNH